MGSIACIQGQGEGSRGQLVLVPISEGIPQDVLESFGVQVSRIRILTSKITQVCQDIHDIKLRRLLITQSDKEPNDITNRILTNQSDRKNTWGSGRSKPDPPVTCLHLLRLPIQVPLIPPPLHISVALTVTIEQPPPFPIDSL